MLKLTSFSKYSSAFILCFFIAIFSFAQEKTTVDINVNDGKGGFFSSPWIWVVGAAVFILLLVALLRGGGKKD